MTTNPGIQRQATAILSRITTGDDSDSAILSELLYDELKSLARQMMNAERADHTLQPTALVHEVFLRLINTDELEVNSENHFMMLAARIMRRVLIDHARAIKRQKRGGDHKHVSLTIADPESNEPISPETLLSIDDALEKLRALDERKAKLVELRFFAGLDEEHAARILGIARSTASSDWRFARAWLLRQLATSSAEEES
jgi:RNA polymerase sigma factor (TIGR02999 family)